MKRSTGKQSRQNGRRSVRRFIQPGPQRQGWDDVGFRHENWSLLCWSPQSRLFSSQVTCFCGLKNFFFFTALSGVVCSIAVLYVVTQRNAMVLPTMLLWLRDDTKNGCEADYSTGHCRYSSQPETIWIGLSTEETEECWAVLSSLFSQL